MWNSSSEPCDPDVLIQRFGLFLQLDTDRGVDLLTAAASALPLLGERCFEALFVLVDMSQVAFGIDKRVRISRGSLLKFGVFVRETLERGVRTDP